MLRLYIFYSTTIHTSPTYILAQYFTTVHLCHKLLQVGGVAVHAYTYLSYVYTSSTIHTCPMYILYYTFATSCCKLLGSLCTPSLRSAPAFNSATATSAYVSIRHGHVSIRQHTPLPRQHTSAYATVTSAAYFSIRHCHVSIRHCHVSIRQHTSGCRSHRACVLLEQNTGRIR
jgi:hypothetical protein